MALSIFQPGVHPNSTAFCTDAAGDEDLANWNVVGEWCRIRNIDAESVYEVLCGILG